MAAEDWPTWRHDAGRTNVSAEKIPAPLHLQWKRQHPPVTPAFRKSRLQFDQGYEPIVLGDTMYIALPHIDADYDYTTAKPTINGKTVHPLGGVVLTPMYNFLNWYPVVNAPTGLTSQNLPMGMQIVANAYQDKAAMRVAAAYASAAPRWYTGSMMPDFRGP